MALLAFASNLPAQTLPINESFMGQDNVTNSPPAGFVLNLGNSTNLVVFTTNGAWFQRVGDANRSYIATADAAYDTVSFEASVDVRTNQPFASFFGFGTGTPSGANFEPLQSIYIRARQTGGAPTVQNAPGGGTFTSFGAGITQPFTMRMKYWAAPLRLISFTLEKAGTATNTVGPFPLPTYASYSVFFGGNNNDTFTNFVVTAITPPTITNFNFVTPSPTLHVGLPTAVQRVGAQLSSGDTADFTSSLNTIYSSTDTAVCDVSSFGGALIANADGVCQIIATNSDLGLSATQTVTVVSSAPSHYLTNTFIGSTTAPTNMYVYLARALNTVAFTGDGVAFTGQNGGTADASRAYLHTIYNTYDSTDFQFDVDVTTNRPFCSFVGIGRGESTTLGGEPANSIYLRLRHNSSQPTLHGGTGLPVFTAWPTTRLGNGPFHVKMSYTTGSGQLYITISTALTNQTVSLPMSTVTTAAAGGGKGVRLFIGGGASTDVANPGFDTFTNLVVQNPIGAGVSPTNLYFVSAPAQLLAGQTTTHPLTVFADFDNGSKSNNVTGFVNPFTSLDPAVFSVSVAGLITAGISGTNNVTADWSGPWGTVSASQEVRVMAPTSLSIELPALYEGTRAANATLKANFSATITNVDVTSFTGVTWSAPQALGFITVAGNVVTPVAQGTEELAVIYDTLSTTQSVTVLPAPAFYRTDSFIGSPGSPLPSGYQSSKQSSSNPGGVVTPAGALFVNAATSQRDYIRSAIDYYDQSNWVATITVKTNNTFSGFFGVGEALGQGAFGEPRSSIYFRARYTNAQPEIRMLVNTGDQGVPQLAFTQWPNGLGSGPFILRMKHEVGVGLSFSILDGVFSETVGPIALPVLPRGYSIFFGGAENTNAMTFANLNIAATAPGVPAAPTLTQGVSGSGMTLTWSDGFLLRAPQVLGPWTPVVGANSPYTFPVNPTNAQEFFQASSPYLP